MNNDNPGDLVTRDFSVHRLSQSDIWWNGPTWLKHGDWSICPLFDSPVLHVAMEPEDNNTNTMTPIRDEMGIQYAVDANRCGKHIHQWNYKNPAHTSNTKRVLVWKKWHCTTTIKRYKVKIKIPLNRNCKYVLVKLCNTDTIQYGHYNTETNTAVTTYRPLAWGRTYILQSSLVTTNTLVTTWISINYHIIRPILRLC